MIKRRLPLVLLSLFSAVQWAAAAKTPNLVVIYTDEHNFRTLGCYRDQLSDAESFIWGEGVKVDTPHIDSLAKEGTLLTSFYAATPVCAPSRASLLSGLYPYATGVPQNNMPMNDDVLTFAQVLKGKGYATSYVGKWHLDGNAKPGWAPARKFGFEDNTYMYNRGHYKRFVDTPQGPKVGAVDKKGLPSYGLNGADEKSYATDFLMDRSIDFIRANKDKPFCVMMSLPDPHGPNTVRAPYDTRFNHLKFDSPATMFKSESETPAWVSQKSSNFIWAQALKQQSMANYFGMVQLIDDNVGKLLGFLKENKLEKDTIVVFTSDHGDLMGEHRLHNKGLPYETSACVAFIVKYPKAVAPSKVIRSAMTTTDFGPTMMNLMGFEGTLPAAHGVDLADEFRSKKAEANTDRIVYIRSTEYDSRWVAAISDRYKLVLSTEDDPWLFDLEKDPEELVNYALDPNYAAIRKELTDSMVDQMKTSNDPVLKIDAYKKWLEF
ncbi:MAG: sulfatase-like hydrolase/transferase [Opitutales bacterium]|nr:sulfatase-like hydrolase/transferase [Opitutales bacterium]